MLERKNRRQTGRSPIFISLKLGKVPSVSNFPSGGVPRQIPLGFARAGSRRAERARGLRDDAFPFLNLAKERQPSCFGRKGRPTHCCPVLNVAGGERIP